jgi:hypothetical protein
MPDPLMYQEEMFVLLIPGKDEEIMTREELLGALMTVLRDRPDNLPRDVAKYPTPETQAVYLLEAACEFTLSPGQTMQWYAIRLEK